MPLWIALRRRVVSGLIRVVGYVEGVFGGWASG